MKSGTQVNRRRPIDLSTKMTVLTEAGYRCAVPTCRQILALDLHHLAQVSDGGGNEPVNLLALCPSCHALYHRGYINRESIYAWKAMLISLSNAFDVSALDKLLLLYSEQTDFLVVSGDGLLHFAGLITAGFAVGELKANNNWQIVSYAVNISPKGRLLVAAWTKGDRAELSELLSTPRKAELPNVAPASAATARSRKHSNR